MNSRLPCVLLIACLGGWAALAPDARAQTPSITHYTWQPFVIPFDIASNVLFEAEVTNITAGMTMVFEYNAVDRPMVDDGTGGDRVAGDRWYTISFTPAEILSKNTATNVFRPVIGFVELATNAVQITRLNMTAEIWSNTIPLVTVTALGTNAQASPRLFNVVSNVPPGTSPNVAYATRMFYQHFEDEYDFLNVIIHFARTANRYHFGAKNTLQGTGQSMFNNTATYGSAGRLLGVSVFPIPGFFDGAGKAYEHELGHQWINFMTGTPFAVGTPHWPLSDVAYGIMGRSLPGGAGGDFPYLLVPEGPDFRAVSTNATTVFNDLELYLMGLIASNQVAPHFVLSNQSQTVVNNALLTGGATYVTISNVIATLGPRVPDEAASQKHFRSAHLVVSPRLLTQVEMSFYEWFAARCELTNDVPFSSGLSLGTTRPFFRATGGRGSLDARLGTPPLRIDRAVLDGNFTLTWPISAFPFALEKTFDLTTPAGWQGEVTPPSLVSNRNSLTLPLGTNAAYYRIR